MSAGTRWWVIAFACFWWCLLFFFLPFTYELFTLSIFTLLILPFILLGVEVSAWQGGGLAVGRGQTTTELLYLYLAVVQAIAISVQQRIFLYLFWKRNILKRNLEKRTLSWQNLRTVLMYGAASKTSLRQVQESSAQRQREQEYNLPKLRTKKKLEWKTAALKQMKGRVLRRPAALSSLLCLIFMHLSEETKISTILRKITDNQTAAWAFQQTLWIWRLTCNGAAVPKLPLRSVVSLPQIRTNS